jgi:hypothetical protein
MRVRPFFVPALAAALVLCGSLASYTVGARSASAKPKVPRAPHHVYRLDYVVSVTEPGKPARTSTYTMNVEEDSGGEVRAGENMPLVTGGPGAGAAPRQDVGLAIRCHLASAGDDLLLHASTELTAPDDGIEGFRAIRKITSSGDAVVAPGKTTVLASVQEPTSHARYEVTVAATKLR